MSAPDAKVQTQLREAQGGADGGSNSVLRDQGHSGRRHHQGEGQRDQSRRSERKFNRNSEQTNLDFELVTEKSTGKKNPRMEAWFGTGKISRAIRIAPSLLEPRPHFYIFADFQKMDSVDLTLTLRLPSVEDDHNSDHPQVFQHPQFPQLVNAPGSSNLTQRFGYGASGNVHAGQNSGMSIIDFQRSVSVSQRRQSVFPHPTKMKEYCVINISNHKVNVGGSRKRTTTHCRRPVRKPDNQNRICTNFNCRVSETPMWRRGPLGPKTLCNACGIKYRKLKLKLKEEQGEDREVSAGEGSSN